jgi:Arc/MetJ family transcription regulator
VRQVYKPLIHVATVESMRAAEVRKRQVRLSIEEDLYLELVRRYGTKKMHLAVNEAIRRFLRGEGR